jgi:hypothetical protein
VIGSIGRYKPKPGSQAALRALDDEWARTIRPKIKGPMLILRGRPQDSPDEMFQVILVHDRKTWARLSQLPEQEKHFQKVMEHLEGEPIWENVELEIWIAD